MVQSGFRAKCPKCGGYNVRKQKGVSKFKYRCYECYWAGNEPSLEPRTKISASRVHESVPYEGIIKNLLSGDTIQDQLRKFGVYKRKITNGREYAVRQKVMRVYGAYSLHLGMPVKILNTVKLTFLTMF